MTRVRNIQTIVMANDPRAATLIASCPTCKWSLHWRGHTANIDRGTIYLTEAWCECDVAEPRTTLADAWDAGLEAFAQGKGSEDNPWREYGR